MNKHVLLKENRQCPYCNSLMTRPDKQSLSSITLDHVVPKSLGGGKKENLIACCRFCNSRKGHFPKVWFFFLTVPKTLSKEMYFLFQEYLDFKVIPIKLKELQNLIVSNKAVDEFFKQIKKEHQPKRIYNELQTLLEANQKLEALNLIAVTLDQLVSREEKISQHFCRMKVDFTLYQKEF